jgi:hypothetical protein
VQGWEQINLGAKFNDGMTLQKRIERLERAADGVSSGAVPSGEADTRATVLGGARATWTEGMMAVYCPAQHRRRNMHKAIF